MLIYIVWEIDRCTECRLLYKQGQCTWTQQEVEQVSKTQWNPEGIG